MSTRNGLLARIHIAKKDLGLDDDTYRDMLQSCTGRSSARDLDMEQLNRMVDHLKACGFKPRHKQPQSRQQAMQPEQRKIRALWISLWHLGLLQDNSDQALAAFCARVTGGRETGIKALQWVRGEDASKVIEALKDWAARDGGLSQEAYRIYTEQKVRIVEMPRQRTLEAQWRILHRLGVVRLDYEKALTEYLTRALKIRRAINLLSLTDSEADAGIRFLGTKIRAAQKQAETKGAVVKRDRRG